MDSSERRDETEQSGTASGVDDSKRKLHKSKSSSGIQDPMEDRAPSSKMSPEGVENTASLVVQEEPRLTEPSTEQKSHTKRRHHDDSRSKKSHKKQEQPQSQQQGKVQQQGPEIREQEVQPQGPRHEKQGEANNLCGIPFLPSPETMIAVCALAGGVIILVVLLVTTKMPTPKTRCVTPACRELLGYMDTIVDKNVKPCHDFYRHVCGHWLGNASMPDMPASSFMADAMRNYTARRHQELMARTTLADPADVVSRYYRNCVAYLSVSRTIREIVDKVLAVANMTLESWLSMPSDETFFKLIQLSFLYRIHAFFRVTTGTTDSKTYLAVDKWSSFKQRLLKTEKDSQGNKYLSAVLKAIGNDDAVIAPCQTLDDSIGSNKTLSSDTSSSLRPALAPASAADCAEFPPDKWIQGVNSQDKLKLPTDTSVLARNFKDICSDLKSVLLHKMLPVRNLYPLALLVADFLNLDFMITSESKTPAAELVQRVCHQDTRATFKRLWLPALTKVLSISPETAESIHGYFSKLIETLMIESVKYPQWMHFRDRIIAQTKASEMRISTFSNGSLSKKETDNSRFHQSMQMSGNDWISNKAIVLTRTKVPDDVDEDTSTPMDEEHLEALELLLLADREKHAILVPHMFAVPPIAFQDISAGSFANLAMWGFQIARKVMSLLVGMREVVPWSNDTARNYAEAQSCYANYSGVFHGRLDDAQFDEAVGAALALRLVLRVGMLVVRFAPIAEEPFFTLPLFFRRACLSLCAGGKSRADVNSLDQDTASAACTVAVGTTRIFHQTFGCSGSDQMAALLRCRI